MALFEKPKENTQKQTLRMIFCEPGQNFMKAFKHKNLLSRVKSCLPETVYQPKYHTDNIVLQLVQRTSRISFKAKKILLNTFVACRGSSATGRAV